MSSRTSLILLRGLDYSNKSFLKRDKTLTSQKFFKRKSSRVYNISRTNESTGGTASGLRNSTEFSAYKSTSKRSQYNGTKSSLKDIGGLTDVKSSFNIQNDNSEYSFYDRGFKEYEYDPLGKLNKKAKNRPMTADVRLRKHPYFVKFLIILLYRSS